MSWGRRTWLLTTALGWLSLSVFFLWSTLDEDSVPIGVAAAAMVGGIAGLIDSALQIRDRRREDKAEPSEAD